MLNLDRVFRLFRLFTDLEEKNAADWYWLCETAASAVEQRLREEVDLPREMDRLCAAAASLAYDRYQLLRSSGLAGELRVGEISLKQGASAPPESLGEHFLKEVADLLKQEGGFLFQRTPGEEA